MDDDDVVSVFVVIVFCFVGLVGENLCSECLFLIVFVCRVCSAWLVVGDPTRSVEDVASLPGF